MIGMSVCAGNAGLRGGKIQRRPQDNGLHKARTSFVNGSAGPAAGADVLGTLNLPSPEGPESEVSTEMPI